MGSRPAAENDEPDENAAGGTNGRGMPRQIIVILGALAPGTHAKSPNMIEGGRPSRPDPIWQ
jgi:hypothetical protein